MINITAEQFEQLLPFVGAASEDVFTKMQPALENVYFDLVATVIGSDFEDAACAEGSALLGNVRSYVILKAFILRLRSNDLIMTDNGFGIVSNEKHIASIPSQGGCPAQGADLQAGPAAAWRTEPPAHGGRLERDCSGKQQHRLLLLVASGIEGLLAGTRFRNF